MKAEGAGIHRQTAKGTARRMRRANVPRHPNTTSSGEVAAKELALATVLALCMDVRKEGLSLRQMGRELVARDPENLRVLGYSPTKAPSAQTCLRWTRRAVEELRQQWRAQSDDTRALVEDRLDAIVNANWAAMQGGDVAAGRLILAAEDRRAKLLGLDKREDKTDLADAIAELVRARTLDSDGPRPGLPAPKRNADVVDAQWSEPSPAQPARDDPPDEPRA